MDVHDTPRTETSLRQYLLLQLIFEMDSEKHEIGLGHFLSGWISQRYVDAHQQHLRIERQDTAKVRITQMLGLIQQLWELRLKILRNQNMCKYRNTTEKREDTLRKRLEPKIRVVYAERHTCLIPSSKW